MDYIYYILNEERRKDMEERISYMTFGTKSISDFIVDQKTKDILLEVANDIESQLDYSGSSWCPKDSGCGCAMYQMTRKLDLNCSEYIITDMLGEVTSIPEEIWLRWTQWTSKNDGPTTAAKLREFAEGKFGNELLRMEAI
jgi:hypothetical protein